MAINDDQLHRLWIDKGDPEAFNELVERYAGLAFSTCRRILRNHAGAEDLTQKCFSPSAFLTCSLLV